MGIVVIIIGLALSIGLHEFGHLIPAKIFGVRVPNWAIGFGPKLLSKKIGETEYSLRLIPLGGFITMIGMYPPDLKGKDSKRPFRNVITAARNAHSEHMEPGDAGKRTLYSLPAWKRIIIMFGGPFVNLVLGVSLLTGVSVSIGETAQTTQIQQVLACMDAMTHGACNADSTPTPAAAAGLLPGDKVISVAGAEVSDYSQLQKALRSASGRISLEIQRAGKTLNLQLEPAFANLQGQGNVRVIGVTFKVEHVDVSFSKALGNSFGSVGETFGMITQFPQQVYRAFESTITAKPRDPAGAVSIVGVAEASTKIDSLAFWLYLLGSLNVALFAFNMIPLPPLDGGHIAGGIYEYLKRGAFRLLGKKDPGSVDTALMAPIAQVIFIILLLAGVLMMYVDLVNPINF